jgi:hypothetical protein
MSDGWSELETESGRGCGGLEVVKRRNGTRPEAVQVGPTADICAATADTAPDGGRTR